MEKQNDFVKKTSIKAAIRAKKVRSSADAIGFIKKSMEALIWALLDESEQIAKNNRKKTILLRHVTAAFEKHVGKSDLNWQEILSQIIQETPADLGKLNKGIRDYIKANSNNES